MPLRPSIEYHTWREGGRKEEESLDSERDGQMADARCYFSGCTFSELAACSMHDENLFFCLFFFSFSFALIVY